MQKLCYAMLVKFTNKCNKFVHINIIFMQKLKHVHLTKFTYNVTTFVVYINIIFMQKLKHAHAH